MTDEEIQSAIDDGAKRGDEDLSALRHECARLETESSGLRNELRTALLRMEALEKRLEETASVAAEAAEAAANATATDVGGGAEGVEPVMSGPDEQPPPTEDREPFAYQVMESDGKVYCFLPKKKEEDESEGSVTSGSDDDEGASEFCGGAYGGPHVGSSTDPIAEADSPPHAKAGYKSNSGASGESSISDEPEQLDFSWAHYGWHEVGELDTSGSGVNDKIVVATFDVPIDPPEDQRSGVSVEGPSLSSIELMDIDDWRSGCKASWKEFDGPTSGEPVQRKIPVALVANGVVTQLCVGVPFVDRGGNGDGGDPTLVDSRDIPSGLPSHLSGKCQKSVDFYEYPTPAPSGLSGEGQYQKTTDNGDGTTTVTRTNNEDEADKTTTGILQLYDFTKPSISVTEMPVPTPEVDSSGSVDGPVFLIRDEGGTGGVCPTLKYTQLKLKDDRCPPPEVWLESGTGDSVTLKVRSWTKNASGVCESGITQYTFTPTSIDAPDCSAIKACISGETQTVVTDVFVSGGNLYKRVRTAKALEWGTTNDVMIVSGTTCEDGEGSVTA